MFFLITVNLEHHQSLQILLWLFFLQSGCQGRLHLWETHALHYTLSKWQEFSSSLIGFESLQNLPAFSNNLPLIHYQSAWLPQSNYLSVHFLAEIHCWFGFFNLMNTPRRFLGNALHGFLCSGLKYNTKTCQQIVK